MKNKLYFHIKGVTAKIYFDKRVKSKSNTYPVKFQITYERKHYYILTGIRLSENDWSILFKSTKKTIKESRELITIGFERIKEIIIEMYKTFDHFSFDLLNQRLIPPNKTTLSHLFEKKIEDISEDSKKKSLQETISFLNRFNKNEPLFPQYINISFLKDFSSYLNKDLNLGYSEIRIHLFNLKTVLSLAKKNNLISSADFPFGQGKFVISKENLSTISNKNNRTFTIEPLDEEQNEEYTFSPKLPENLYREAVEKYFNCRRKDYQLKVDHKLFFPYMVQFNGDIYQIVSDYDLENAIVNAILKEHEFAGLFLPLHLINEVGEGVMTEKKFYDIFVPELSPDEKNEFLLALNLYNATQETIIFWETLYDANSPELYGKAVMAMSKTYNFSCVVDEIKELFLYDGYGEINLCELQNGVFEIINLQDDNDEKSYCDEKFHPLFFIFSIDDVNWDI